MFAAGRTIILTTISRTIAMIALLVIAGVSLASAQGRPVTEEFRLHEHYTSKFLSKDRDIIVWLPPGYQKETTKHYPVLYMHDGLSVFANWRLDETAAALIANNEIEPLIIVCVANGGSAEDRYDEYTPTRDPGYTKSGNANNYGRMLVEELKPFIDSKYRTLTDAANTGLGGASLGGLVSLYLGLKYPETFTRLAVLSPSIWWDERMILRQVKGLTSKPPLRIWLDVGTDEEKGRTDVTKLLRDALKAKGWVLDSDLTYFEAKGAKHEEAAFARRGGLFLKFLFPKQKSA
jgi:predicted alpha/beta superfamily hydrolase